MNSQHRGRTARRFTKFGQMPLEIHVVGYVTRATLKPEAIHPNGSCLSRNLPNLDGVMQSRDGAGRHGTSLLTHSHPIIIISCFSFPSLRGADGVL
jgi:hypothetical protein